jgi:hypothetical protein
MMLAMGENILCNELLIDILSCYVDHLSIFLSQKFLFSEVKS